MKKALISALSLVLGSAVLGATVLQEPVARAAAPIASVFVTNDASNPVPVREQNLDANGSIKVHEQGTADVNVTNSSLTVTDVGSPVQATLTLQFVGFPADESTSYVVPAGKRLRIGTVTFHDLNRPVGVESVALVTTAGGQIAGHWLATSAQATGGEVTTESVEIYADPGSAVRIVVRLDAPLGAVGSPQSMLATFSGVLIDAA